MKRPISPQMETPTVVGKEVEKLRKRLYFMQTGSKIGSMTGTSCIREVEAPEAASLQVRLPAIRGGTGAGHQLGQSGQPEAGPPRKIQGQAGSRNRGSGLSARAWAVELIFVSGPGWRSPAWRERGIPGHGKGEIRGEAKGGQGRPGEARKASWESCMGGTR
jgi:hypothetical protein